MKQKLHGSLYKFFKDTHTQLPKDVCTLIRSFVFNFFSVILLGVFSILLDSCFLIGNLLFLGAIFGLVPLMPVGSVWLFIMSISLAIDIVAGLIYLTSIAAKKLHSISYSEPGIVRSAYRGWKEKYCPIVEWE